MSSPVRIQLSRRKGWKMPPGAVKVDRSTRWGNPFPLSGYSAEEAVHQFRILAESSRRLDPSWLHPLRGKDLACWCRPGATCHADVLLEMANADPVTP